MNCVFGLTAQLMSIFSPGLRACEADVAVASRFPPTVGGQLIVVSDDDGLRLKATVTNTWNEPIRFAVNELPWHQVRFFEDIVVVRNGTRVGLSFVHALVSPMEIGMVELAPGEQFVDLLPIDSNLLMGNYYLFGVGFIGSCSHGRVSVQFDLVDFTVGTAIEAHPKAVLGSVRAQAQPHLGDVAD